MNVALARPEATLDSRYDAPEGWLYMTGMQALVRLPIQQRLRDAAQGLNTGGYISGYRGSPLGRYDIELWRAAPLLKSHNIVFRPGLNEDLAATAIWGAQYLNSFPGATVDGVFGIWYGKGPGVDRSGDALRHANFTGASPKGGAIALAGDDHGAKSSTAVNFSDTSFIAVGMPVMYPSNTQELLDFGLHGIAMSRFSGCWVGMKVVTDVAEGGGTVYVGPDSPTIVIPERPSNPPGGFGARTIDAPVAQEERLYNHKLPAALAYSRANGLNRIISAGRRKGRRRRGGQSLAGPVAGARQSRPRRQWRFAWPAPAQGRHGVAARFRSSCATSRDGLDLVVVVEEKRPLIEDQIRSILYGAHDAPRIVGKYFDGARVRSVARRAGHPQFWRDHARTRRRGSGQSAFPPRSELRVERAGDAGHSAQQSSCADAQPGLLRRVPAQSLDRGARGQPGARRHRLPLDGDAGQSATDRDRFAYGRRRHDVAWATAVYAPGPRVRQHWRRHLRPFRVACYPSGDRGRYPDHLQDPLQRLRLDDRRAADRGRHDAGPDPGELAAEGVKKMALVADEPERYAGVPLPQGVSLRHRDAMDETQREFREYKGVSVILYDQPCATERRRLRKRGKWPDPAIRTFINAEVCEGCGDCGQVSNCMAIEPLETDFGPQAPHQPVELQQGLRCIDGFCPSFVTVHGGRLRKPERRRPRQTSRRFRSRSCPYRRAVQRARRRHRRFRHCHGEPDARDRRLSRRAFQYQSRPDRPQPEIWALSPRMCAWRSSRTACMRRGSPQGRPTR